MSKKQTTFSFDHDHQADVMSFWFGDSAEELDNAVDRDEVDLETINIDDIFMLFINSKTKKFVGVEIIGVEQHKVRTHFALDVFKQLHESGPASKGVDWDEVFRRCAEENDLIAH